MACYGDSFAFCFYIRPEIVSDFLTDKRGYITNVSNFFLKEFCIHISTVTDRLCGLVIGVLGYRTGGPGSIPGTTKKKGSGSGTGSTQPREYN
jgi:hypothetical protein